MEKPILDPPIPYIGPIYGGKFSPGKLVRIQGIVPGIAYRFNVSLQCGSESLPDSDSALYISMRIRDAFISLNSLQNETWDAELRGLLYPIECGQKFEITIKCDSSKYSVALNGQHYCDFPQRVHYNRISHLSIDGDVSIIKISYESTAKPKNISESGISINSGAFSPVSFSPMGDMPVGCDFISQNSIKRRRSYEAAIYATEGGFVGAPYATSTSSLTETPRMSPSVSPHPTNGAAGVCSIDIPEELEKPTRTAVSAAGRIESGSQPPVKDTDWKKSCSNCWGFIIGGSFIFACLRLYM